MYSYTPIKAQGSPSQGSSWFAFRPCWGLFVCLGVLLAVVVVLWFAIPAVLFLPDPVVSTACGESHGYIDNVTQVFVFKGIQYAAPPVGRLRWKAPEPVDKETCQNLDADPPPCVQRDKQNTSAAVGSEDCLYLNVYSPHITPWVLAPVVVWIHGGGFMSGSISEPGFNPDPELAEALGSVIISVQYRLNVFGWLVSRALPKSAGHEGNYALLDLLQALHWIQNNIQNFGGDPNQVTLLGFESGATSAILLTWSDLSRGLFHRVVSLSADPYVTPTPYEEMEDENERIVEKVGCKDSACLLGLSQGEALNMIYPEWETDSKGLDFPSKRLDSVDYSSQPKAVLDGRTLPWFHTPNQEVLLHDVPVLVGTAAQEVDLFPSPGQPILNWSQADLSKYLDRKLKTFQNPALNINKTLMMYTDSDNENVNSFEAEKLFSTIVTDIRVTCQTHDVVLQMSDSIKSSIYQYVLTAVPSSSLRSDFNSFPSRYAFRGFDVLALFDNLDIALKNVSETDRKLRDDLRAMLKMFIEKGQVNWKEVPLEIRLIGSIMETVASYHKEECEYWRENGLLNPSQVD